MHILAFFLLSYTEALQVKVRSYVLVNKISVMLRYCLCQTFSWLLARFWNPALLPSSFAAEVQGIPFISLAPMDRGSKKTSKKSFCWPSHMVILYFLHFQRTVVLCYHSLKISWDKNPFAIQKNQKQQLADHWLLAFVNDKWSHPWQVWVKLFFAHIQAI